MIQARTAVARPPPRLCRPPTISSGRLAGVYPPWRHPPRPVPPGVAGQIRRMQNVRRICHPGHRAGPRSRVNSSGTIARLHPPAPATTRQGHRLHAAARLVSCSASRYTARVIVSFRHKGLEDLYRTGSTRGVKAAHASKLRRILSALDAAASPSQLNHPGYRLHPLKGNLQGHWSIWVNGNWRVTFRFDGPDVERVDYRDYH